MDMSTQTDTMGTLALDPVEVLRNNSLKNGRHRQQVLMLEQQQLLLLLPLQLLQQWQPQQCQLLQLQLQEHPI